MHDQPNPQKSDRQILVELFERLAKVPELGVGANMAFGIAAQQLQGIDPEA